MDVPVRDRLHLALRAAMKTGDRTATRVLRSTLGAVDNAGSVGLDTPVIDPSTADGPIAGAVAGLGSTEVARRSLTATEVEQVVADQIAERREAAADYERADVPERAAELRREIAVLTSVLAGD